MDFSQLLNEFGGNKLLLDGAIKTFIRNIIPQIEEVKEALSKGDFEIIAKQMHKIRGGAGNLMAMDIYRIAENIENAAKRQDKKEIEDNMPGLENEIGKLKDHKWEGL